MTESTTTDPPARSEPRHMPATVRRVRVLNDIAGERDRRNGSDIADDQRTRGELAAMAAAFAHPTVGAIFWPLNHAHPFSVAGLTTRGRLVRAAALLVAEIERLDRQKSECDCGALPDIMVNREQLPPEAGKAANRVEVLTRAEHDFGCASLRWPEEF